MFQSYRTTIGTSFAKFALIFSLAYAAAAPSFAAAEDKEGGKDHELLSRFPDTTIVSWHESDYDSFTVPTGPRETDPMPPHLAFEGKISSLTYQANDPKYSILNVYRNYEQAFKKLGFEEIFACQNDANCGQKFVTQVYWYGDVRRPGMHQGLDAPNMHGADAQYRFWAGKATIAGKDTYATLLVALSHRGVIVVQDIYAIEELAMDKIKTLDPAQMKKDVEATGKTTLEGLYFETNDAKLKNESSKSLEAIASYLKSSTAEIFYVVGHTDNEGIYAYNLDLSQRRAQSVIDELASSYEISPQQLIPVGVGSVSPVESNDAEEGRAKNRRVELVKA